MTAAMSPPVPILLEVDTLRFGRLTIPPAVVYHFPHGLPGFEAVDHFALLPVRDGLRWLQAIVVPSLAFLLVEPGRVLAGAWAGTPEAWAIVTLGDAPERCTANLRAPILLDPVRRSGGQWISPDPALAIAQPVNLTRL